MDPAFVLSKCDHTLLRQDCDWPQIRTLCDEGMAFRCASVCLPPLCKTGGGLRCGQNKCLSVIGLPQRLFHHRGQGVRN
jgi:deoxyribose-phosphate aldolase